MKQPIPENLYQTAIYLRLSQEDGDISAAPGKNESNSISTQRELLMAFLKKHPELRFVEEYCDDGYTGTNFDRPAFLRMMEDVRSNRINCIVVKDLSRFGRDYIETGKYTQKIFPALGIRFIAVNDGFDSLDTENQANDFILPFKNLINDSYCRDISIKSRTNLEVKRQNGEFVNNFPVFGYLRSPDDKHKLIVDEDAAVVVRDIFRWKEAGWNAQDISDHLNRTGVLSPLEYKKKIGCRYRTTFKCKPQAEWSASAVLRILKNPVYAGTLVQGRTTTPNYKVKIRRMKDESEWARVENAHEAIIAPAQFDLIQKLLSLDTRRAECQDQVYLFSGLIFCAECGSPMIHRNVYTDGKKYQYYICSGNKKDMHFCSLHNIRCTLVEDAVLATIQAHIAAVLTMRRMMSQAECQRWEKREEDKIDAQITALEEANEKYTRLKMELYEDKKSGLLSAEDYVSFKEGYDEKIQTQKAQIAQLTSQKNAIFSGSTEQQSWFSQIQKYENIQALSRVVVVNLIDRIEVSESKEIHVTFRYQDQFSDALDRLPSQRKGAV